MLDKRMFYDQFFEAERLRAEGRFGEAIVVFRELLSQRLETAKNPTEDLNNYDAIIIERLADLSQLFGNDEASIDFLSGLRQLFLKAENIFFYLNTTIKIASVYLEGGDFEAAFGFLEELVSFIGDLRLIEISSEGLAKWEKGCHFEKLRGEERSIIFSKIYYVMGALLTGIGRYDDGIQCLESGFEWISDFKDEICVGMHKLMFLKKMEAMVEKGNVNAAKQEIGEARREGLTDMTPGTQVGFLELKSRISFLQGELGKAEELMANTSELCGKYGLRQAEVAALLNLAKVKILLNQLAEAEEILDCVQQMCKDLSDESTMDQVLQLKDLVVRRGQPMDSTFDLSPTAHSRDQKREKTPKHQLGEMFAPFRPPSSFLGLFEERSLELQILLADGEWEEALELFEHMKSVFSKTDSRLIRSRLSVFRLLVDFYAKGLEQLPADIRDIQSYFEKESLKPELRQFQMILGWTGLLSPAENHELIRRNEQLLEEMTQSLPPESRALFLLNKWTEDERYLNYLVEELMYIEAVWEQRWKIFKPIGAIKSLRRLNRLLFHIDRHKDITARKSIGGKESEDQVAKPASWLLSLLKRPWDRVTISFLVLPDRVVLVYRSFLKLDFKVIPLSRIHLRERVKEIHENLAHATQNRDIRELDESERRSNVEALIQEISEAMGVSQVLSELPDKVKRITFVPDDVLNGFPFAALRFNGDYLVKGYSVTLGYESRRFKRSKPKQDRQKLLMVGVSCVSDGKNTSLDLPFVKPEISEIRSEFGGKAGNIETLFDAEAEKESILKKVGQARFFHIACHGVFNHYEPDTTGLILHNGDTLSLRDILEIDSFDGVEHVTLSSCWGADHFILPGRWVVSLPETLWRSGVDGILGCMWQVNDEVAVWFMKEFYEQMKKHPRDIALQETQKLALNDEIPGAEGRTRDMFFWSGFNLYGAYDRVRF